jgi:hypothetical protein
MKRHFRVYGQLDRAGRAQAGTVTIDEAGIFHVRPLRRRRTFSLPLSTVADIVCRRIIFTEHAAKRAAKKKARRR